MLPSEIKNSRILISPLNWGWGHVSRCIPIINQLRENDNIVFIASDQYQELVFRQYFSDVFYIKHDGYPFRFSKKGNFEWDIFLRTRSHYKRYTDEINEVSKYVKEYQIDIIISDHRYGFYSNKIPSFFLTHQLNLPLKWHEIWIQKAHHKLIRSFFQIWIPDTPNSDFAGKLSVNNDKFNTNYIGPISRFSLYEKSTIKSIDNLIVVSGPNIYGSELLKYLQLSMSKMNSIVIASNEVLKEISNPDNAVLQVSDNWPTCDELFLKSKNIISRSGYSTLMDIHELKTNSYLIPTKGQREQEYLYELHFTKKKR